MVIFTIEKQSLHAIPAGVPTFGAIGAEVGICV